MLSIEFPSSNFKIRQKGACDEIFDPVRKRWILLTPEEWVRQNFIAFLVERCSVSYSLIGVEKKLTVGELSRRFDIVVFSSQGNPLMVVECKAINVPLGSNTISQVLSYVSALQCPYFVVTNGNQTYGWRIVNGNLFELEAFPGSLHT